MAKKSNKKITTSLAEMMKETTVEKQTRSSRADIAKAEAGMAKAQTANPSSSEVSRPISVKKVLYKGVTDDLKDYFRSKASQKKKESLLLFICTAAFNQELAKVLSKMFPKEIIDRKLWTECECTEAAAAVIGNLILSVDTGIMSPVLKDMKTRWMKVNGGYSCCFTATKIGVMSSDSAPVIAMASASETFSVSDQVELRKVITANIAKYAFTDKSYLEEIFSSMSYRALFAVKKYSPVGAEFVSNHVRKTYILVRRVCIYLILLYYLIYVIPYVWSRKGLLNGVIDASVSAIRVTIIVIFGGAEQMMGYFALGFLAYLAYPFIPFPKGDEDKARAQNNLEDYTKMINAMKADDKPLEDIKLRIAGTTNECEEDFAGSTIESTTEKETSSNWGAASAPAGGAYAAKKKKVNYRPNKKVRKERWPKGENIPDTYL